MRMEMWQMFGVDFVNNTQSKNQESSATQWLNII